jgi:dihydroneopterin triphosphate diphosphatase
MAEVVSRAIEMVPFRLQRDIPEVLLLHRSPGEPMYPGIWQIITGMIEPGERALDTAIRELREETGLSAMRIWNVPFVNSFYDPRKDLVHMMPVFAAQLRASDDVRLSAEHNEFRWVSFRQAAGMVVWPGQRTGLRVVEEEILAGRASEPLTKIDR